MFRTWAANHILLKKLLEYQLPENVNQANKNGVDPKSITKKFPYWI